MTATAGFTTYYFGNFNGHGVARAFQRNGGDAPPIPDDKRFWYMTTQFNDPAKSIASSSQTEYSTVSALEEYCITMRGKYYLNASLRDDGSSQITGQKSSSKILGSWGLPGK